MANLISATLQDLLGPDIGAAILPDEPLMTSGVNSTTAVALTSRLEQALGVELPATLVFDYASIREMSEYLVSSYEAAAPAAAAAAAPVTFATPAVPAAYTAAPSLPPAASATAPVAAASAPRDAVSRLVQAAVADILGTSSGGGGAGAVSASMPLMAAGLTSTAAVQLTSSLEQALGTPLSATLTFDYPTIDAIVDYIVEEGLAPAGAAAAATAAPGASAATAAAAVVTRQLAPMPAMLSEDAILIAATSHKAPGGSLGTLSIGGCACIGMQAPCWRP